jgi:hypothetical protein
MNTVTAMKDTIVQEVCEARAAVSADFDCDLGKFFTWAKTLTAAECKAKHPLTTQPANPTKPKPRKAARVPVI